jgi:hypothetical protein
MVSTRDVVAREPGQVAPERHQVAGLLDVVELAHEAAAKLLQHAGELEAPADVRVRVDECADLFQGLHVVDDPLADAGPLDLHRESPAVAQPRAVHLSQRGGGHRGGLELGERLGEPDAQLGGHDALDVVERKWVNLVLQPGEGGQVGRWQQIRTR